MEDRISQTEKELQKELSKAEKKCRETKIANQLKLEKLEVEHEKLGRKFDDKKRAMNKELDKLQASHERKMKTLHNDLEDTEANMASAKKLKTSLNEAQGQIKKLTSEAEATATKLEAANSELKHIEDQHRLLESELRQETASNTKLKEDNAALQDELEASKKKLSLQLSDDENVQRLQTENSGLESKIQEMKRARDEVMEDSKRRERKWEEDLIKKSREVEELTSKCEKVTRELLGMEERKVLRENNGIVDGSCGKGNMNLAALFKEGANYRKVVRKRISLGELHEDVSARMANSFGSVAGAGASAGQEGVGSGSMNWNFDANGEAKGKAKIVTSKVTVGEVRGGASGAMPIGSRAGSGVGQSARTVSSSVNVSIPAPSIPSPVKEAPKDAPIQRLFPIHKKEAFLASNKTDACGTLVVNLDPFDYLDDEMKLKRFIINTSAEICRTLGVSSKVVSISNPRAYPILLDIVIAGDSPSTVDIMVKLAGICRDDSSPLRRGGSGILSNFTDLVPMISAASSSPQNGSSSSLETAKLKEENKEMSRTINTLKANLKGYHDAKHQMNENLGNSVSETKAIKSKMLEMEGEVVKVRADLKIETDKAKLLEVRLEEAQNLLEASSSNTTQLSTQLLKDLTECRSKEGALNSKILEGERQISELQHQLKMLRTEAESRAMEKTALEDRVKALEVETERERETARTEKEAVAKLTSQNKIASLENEDLSRMLASSEQETKALRGKVHNLLSSEKSNNAAAPNAFELSSASQSQSISTSSEKLMAAVSELHSAKELLLERDKALQDAKRQSRENAFEKQDLERRLMALTTSKDIEINALKDKNGDPRSIHRGAQV